MIKILGLIAIGTLIQVAPMEKPVEPIWLNRIAAEATIEEAITDEPEEYVLQEETVEVIWEPLQEEPTIEATVEPVETIESSEASTETSEAIISEEPVEVLEEEPVEILEEEPVEILEEESVQEPAPTEVQEEDLVEVELPESKFFMLGGEDRLFHTVPSMESAQGFIDEGEIINFPHADLTYGTKYFAGHNPGAMEYFAPMGVGDHLILVSGENSCSYLIAQEVVVPLGTYTSEVSFIEGWDLFDMIYTEDSPNAVILQFCKDDGIHLYYGEVE